MVMWHVNFGAFSSTFQLSDRQEPKVIFNAAIWPWPLPISRKPPPGCFWRQCCCWFLIVVGIQTVASSLLFLVPRCCWLPYCCWFLLFLVSLLLLVPCCLLYRFCYFFLAVAGWFIAVFSAPAVPDSTFFMESWLLLVSLLLVILYCVWRPSCS